MPPILSVKNVHFVRNHRAILNGVTWTINPGEHWAILGANGSGKTTLLKLVTGYEWATEGSIEVLGERFGETDVRALRKHVGWVSSSLEHRLPANDRVIDVVLSGLEATLGVYRTFEDSEKDAALCALGSIGSEDLARKRYGVLSQGEQQRVLIARALVAKPSVLILDEPCAGLDPAARYRFLDDMSRLAQSDSAPALILVTHHIEEIGPWISNVLVLKSGSVLRQGSPASTLTDDVLSEAFSIQCRVKRAADTWQLHIEK